DVLGVGKISDIFAGRGLTENRGANRDNADGMEKTERCLERDFEGLCFVNLVDFDMVYGHRNDADGYAAAIARFDEWLKNFLPKLKDGDVLMITADHGCDPDTPSTDHSASMRPSDVRQGVRAQPRHEATLRTSPQPFWSCSA
ncbi:MAG: phosphopentomutase, partial [Christensenellaceae bacterium]